jgi:predicted transcriptional regulator
MKKNNGNAKLTMFVRVDPETREKIEAIAKRETRTVSNVILLALHSYLREKIKP